MCLLQPSNEQNIAILTDSKAASKAFRTNQVNFKLVWLFFNRLNLRSSHKKAWILLITSRMGLQRNEAADELVRKEAGMPLNGPKPLSGMGKGFIGVGAGRTNQGSLGRICTLKLAGFFKPRQGEP